MLFLDHKAEETPERTQGWCTKTTGTRDTIKNQEIIDTIQSIFKENMLYFGVVEISTDIGLFTNEYKKEKYLKYVSSLSFTPISLYDYKDAQVTVGGYDVNTHIKNVYLLGEMKNIDGLCGGYNLRYVISEGFRFALNYK